MVRDHRKGHGRRRPWRHHARLDRASRARAAAGRHALFYRPRCGLRLFGKWARPVRLITAITYRFLGPFDPGGHAGYHTPAGGTPLRSKPSVTFLGGRPSAKTPESQSVV